MALTLRIRKALTKSDARWRSLAHNTPSFITIIDKSHKILYINHPVPGLSHEEVVGKSVYDFISPEFHAIAKASIYTVLNRGISTSYTSQAAGPDGTISWYHNILSPIIEDEEITAITFIANDITERKEREMEVHLLNQIISQVFNKSIKDPVRVVDMNKKILYVNEAFEKFVGLDTERIINHKCHEIFRGGDCNTESCTLSRVLTGKIIEENTEPIGKENGDSRGYKIVANPLKDQEGNIIGMFETFIKIK